MTRTLIFDIETNGLLNSLTKIHCMVIYDVENKTYFNCIKGRKIGYPSWSLEDGLRMLEKADVVIGHNIIGFDIPAIKKIYPYFNFKPKTEIVDTLISSKLVFPDIHQDDEDSKYKIIPSLKGRYSLEAFGYRLDILKDEYGKQNNAWKHWSPEMQHYCKRDVEVTKALYESILEIGYSKEAIELEHEFASIIFEQEQRGVLFDTKKAYKLEAELREKQLNLFNKLQKAFPPKLCHEEFTPKKNNCVKGYIKGATFNKIWYEEFNPGSRQQIANRLMAKGWIPTIFTEPTPSYPNGQPKVDEDVLSTIEFREAKILSEYLMVNKLLGQLADGDNAWLKYVTSTNRIHGRVNTLGAVTRRCTHSKPNLAQVPSVDKPYGKECRSLFKAPFGYKFVGCDASGLELRCLAHFMNDKDYINEILSGDIHIKNMKMAGLSTKEEAKRFIYAFLYGAGAALIGEIAGGDHRKGKKLKERFLSNLPALDALMDRLTSEVDKKGYIEALDGSHLRVRDSYKALNVLLQSTGAIVMKKALCILHKNVKNENLRVHFVLNIHDEYQAEVHPNDVARYSQLAVEAIREAGRYYNFNCPLDGEVKIGRNWSETH